MSLKILVTNFTYQPPFFGHYSLSLLPEFSYNLSPNYFGDNLLLFYHHQIKLIMEAYVTKIFDDKFR